MRKFLFPLLGLALAILPGFAAAADATAKPEAKPDAKPAAADAKDKPKDGEERRVETRHRVSIGGQTIEYTAVAGTLVLRDADQKPTASIFYIAYVRDGVKDVGSRPLTFSFNGGPGSSSVWMHLGLLGPQRVVLAEDGSALPPPYRLVDNEYSLLDVSDLVFIDPVSTGFSRATDPKDAGKFHGLKEDAASVAEFIRLYLTRNQRWPSPKFVIGESYGTTRAAALSGELSQRHKLNLNGIILVSTVLNFQTIDAGSGNDLAYLLYLPSYTATAWFHKKLPPDLQQLPLTNVLALARDFATTNYNLALFRGATLTPDQRGAFAAQLAHFTGLTAAYTDRADLRVSMGRFAAELLAEQHRVLGRYDGRYTGYVRDRLASAMEQDPSFEAVASAFASAFNHYVRTDLKYESDLPYEVITSVGPWNWGEVNGFVNVAETLASAMTRNPFLKVEACCGYYDLATPFFATEYTFSHMGIDPSLLSNVTIDYFTAGHMMYLNLPDLKKQKADLARFIRSASSPAK
jgi:carboxypeptidase C (cathepsin A)